MTAAPAAQVTREPEANPLEGFVHDVDVTRFDSRLGRIVPIALAVLVGVIAANLGATPALGAGILVAAGLVVAVIALERAAGAPRTSCTGTWRTDTGAGGRRRDRTARSSADPAEAEMWLGAHPPGSVPQVYRAITAVRARRRRS